MRSNILDPCSLRGLNSFDGLLDCGLLCLFEMFLEDRTKPRKIEEFVGLREVLMLDL